MPTEYRVRVKRFGARDQVWPKRTVGAAVRMLQEWEAERDGRFRGTLNGSAELIVEARDVTEWKDVTASVDEQNGLHPGPGDSQDPAAV